MSSPVTNTKMNTESKIKKTKVIIEDDDDDDTEFIIENENDSTCDDKSKKLNKSSLGHLLNRIKKYDADENQSQILAVIQLCYDNEAAKAKDKDKQRRSEYKGEKIKCDCGMNILRNNFYKHKESSYHQKYKTI